MNGEMALASIVCGLFSLASVVAVAALLHPDRSAGRSSVTVLAAAGALCLVASLVMRGVRTSRFPAFGGFEALAWYALAVTAAYVYLALRHETRALSAIVLPYVTVMVALGLPGIKTVPEVVQLQSVWLGLHVVTAFAGYGLFTLESILAVAYLLQDYNLKHKRFGAVFQRFPSLEKLDALMIELIGIAFLLFSISMGLGVVLVHQHRWGTNWTTDPKVAGTAATWLVYAILFHLRSSADQHGRKVALAAVFGLVCVLLTFLGVHLVADSMHDFIYSYPRG